MSKIIYVVYSGNADETEATNTSFYYNISNLYEALETLTEGDTYHLKSQGTRKPLRSTTALDNCLDDDTVYLELMAKTKVVSWYNVNKIDLEVTLG